MINTLRCRGLHPVALSTRLSRVHQRNAACKNLDNSKASARLAFEHLRTFTISRPIAGPTESLDPTGNAGTVSLNLTAGGVTTRIHVKPSYIQKPKAVENLLKNLPLLLTDAVMPATAIESFSTEGWDLDEASDTIHRYISAHPSQIALIVDAIKAASKAENHDPHIHIDGSRMTISCTTHVPPGLSMKDVKLAKAIDKILDEHDIEYDRDSDMSEADILTYRQRGREHNMEAVRQAKLACNCG